MFLAVGVKYQMARFMQRIPSDGKLGGAWE